MVGGIHPPSQLAHGMLHGLFFPLAADGTRDLLTHGQQASTRGSHGALLHVFLAMDTLQALDAKGGENVCDGLFNCCAIGQAGFALSPCRPFLQRLWRLVQTLLHAHLSGRSGGHRLDQQAALFPGRRLSVYVNGPQLNGPGSRIRKIVEGSQKVTIK